jgi:hypothetical protein
MIFARSSASVSPFLRGVFSYHHRPHHHQGAVHHRRFQPQSCLCFCLKTSIETYLQNGNAININTFYHHVSETYATSKTNGTNQQIMEHKLQKQLKKRMRGDFPDWVPKTQFSKTV